MVQVKLAIKTKEDLKEIIVKNFSIYRRKYKYSPLYLISNDNEVFEVGYFNNNTHCTYKKSDVTQNDILYSSLDEYAMIENIDKISDFNMGLYSLVQDMYKLKNEQGNRFIN